MVIPRKDAEEAYEGAISEGNSAFRLQEIRRGIYNATLGNVMAGESIEITLTYAEVLAWNGRSIRYRVPTTIAPRYGEPSGMQPWQRPVTSLEPEYPLCLNGQRAWPLGKILRCLPEPQNQPQARYRLPGDCTGCRCDHGPRLHSGNRE